MAQTMINFRIDEDIKKSMEQACKDMGLTITSAFTIFATKVGKERRIPFEIIADVDPFYSDINMARLRKSANQMNLSGGTIHDISVFESEFKND